jgi:membrane-bound metal-dependent hydrolase YbcI (DUF457 family)
MIHIILASAVGMAFAVGTGPLLCLAFGSLLPDIDNRYSLLGRYNPFVGLMRHRGHCHSIIGIMLLSAPFLAFGIYPAAFILTGSATHLIGDKAHSWLHRRKNKFKLKIW